MVSERRLSPNLTFLALTILIGVIASTLAHSVTDPGRHRLIGTAVSLDLTLTVTFLYYWLLIRPGLRSKTTMFFIAILGLWRASFLFPDVVPGRIWIGGTFELVIFAAIGTALWRSRNAVRDGDPVERLRTAFLSFVPVPAAAGVMASECAVLYYGLCGWRSRPYVPAGSRAFTMHKRSMVNDLLSGLAVVSLLEIVPVHILLNHWSGTAAWIVTGLSVYGVFWMVAVARAFTLRPTLVGAEEIVLRYGLLFHLRIPVDQIRSIRESAEPPAGAFILPRGSTPSMYLELAEPLEAEVILGLRKRVTTIGLRMDDAAGFKTAIQIFPRQPAVPCQAPK